jgi:hypothetical protein
MYLQYTGSASVVHAQGGESSPTNAPLSSGDQSFQYQVNPTLADYIVQYPQQHYSFSQPYLNPYNIAPQMSVTQYPPYTENIGEDCKSPKLFMQLTYFSRPSHNNQWYTGDQQF